MLLILIYIEYFCFYEKNLIFGKVQFVPKGLVINFVSTPAEMECLKKIQEGFHVKIDELPSTIEPSQYSKIAFCEK